MSSNIQKTFHIFFLLLILLPYFSACGHEKDNLIAVVIMVKDEVDVIMPTLEPFLNNGINAILVYDTGSTDGTQEKIYAYKNQHTQSNIHVIEEPFIDFATSRNKALDKAHDLFPLHTFFIMIDAEWYLHNIQELIQFCLDHRSEDGSCYSIRLITKQDNIDNYATRLFRNGKNIRYSGVVHESIAHPVAGFLPASIYFEYSPEQCGKEKSKKRYQRDYDLLKNSLKNDSTNARTLFYLGQTCQFLDKWDEAIFYYQKRAEIQDFSEECYIALYRIGCAFEYLYVHHNTDNRYSWYDALHYYLKAHALWPFRAEPLVRIANYYIYTKEYSLAYIFAKRAVDLSYPSHDVLFIERNVYDFMRYDLLSQAALYVHEYEIGKNALLKALKNQPHLSYLHYNLVTYLQYITV